MPVFRSIVFAAALSGLLAGLLLTVVHHYTTVPYILAAEVFEGQAEEGQAGAEAAPPAEAHDHGEEAADHAHEGWAPADGAERILYTAAADVVTGIAFAFLLVAGFALTGRAIGWHEGLLWGMAGFVAFMVAPSLGLPPELPGMEAAPLGARQVWWIAATASTVAGLGLIGLLRAPWSAALGVLLLVAPHAVGAPPPPDAETLVPHSLLHGFIVAVTISSFLFWAALGVVAAFLYERFGIRAQIGAGGQASPEARKA
ncbi:CbtA family protein [Marinivivus vitaminiproducens]|uniref:CbtA family protein n=1 Tax=Marinivivus vitaminiproducens TaxID=3035935 RepID=UPI0027A64478|nr:CbtA family protein [Geminicoccaceae bacterium SCSIO 64248]